MKKGWLNLAKNWSRSNIFCIMVYFTSDHQILCSLYKVRHTMGALIITYSRPLLRASYEVIVHPSSIWLRQKCYPLSGSNPGPLGHESSTLTALPGPNTIKLFCRQLCRMFRHKKKRKKLTKSFLMCYNENFHGKKFRLIFSEYLTNLSEDPKKGFIV